MGKRLADYHTSGSFVVANLVVCTLKIDTSSAQSDFVDIRCAWFVMLVLY